MFRLLAVRLTLLYTLLFSLLALVVFSLVYYNLKTDLIARVDTGLFNEGQELAAIYQQGGLSVLFSEIHAEAAEEGVENAFYQRLFTRAPANRDFRSNRLGWPADPIKASCRPRGNSLRDNTLD
ncbi:MAG: hypothetical protein ACSLFC_14110 [Desulfuromonadales bacterium]